MMINTTHIVMVHQPALLRVTDEGAEVAPVHHQGSVVLGMSVHGSTDRPVGGIETHRTLVAPLDLLHIYLHGEYIE